MGSPPKLTEDDVRRSIRSEFSRLLEQFGVNIDDFPIQIKAALSKGDFEQSGSTLHPVGRLKEGYAFLARKGRKYVAIILFLFNPYCPAELLWELVVPGLIPDVKRVAAIARDGVIGGYKYLTAYDRYEPEIFVALNRKWETYKPEEYTQFVDNLRGSTMDDFVNGIKNPLDWQFVSASGINPDILASSTNVTIRPSSSASPSPGDIEEA